MTRFARAGRVFFFEEPEFDEACTSPRLRVSEVQPQLFVATPVLPTGRDEEQDVASQRELLGQLVRSHDVRARTAWFYTPMALRYARDLSADVTVYDCMDELSAFRGSPPEMVALERELFGRADVVFTGGWSLYEAKRSRHRRVHAFPSSVDAAHFARAREALAEPADQASIGRPRLGFFGVIDERLDLALIDAVAAARPDWQVVLVGPVVKIDEATLPRRANIHYLGQKAYEDLPAYLSSWDVAVMPFAMNEATQYISPTKTLEYLAAGRPIVSTPVRDVVRPYGEKGLVRIAATAEAFVAACEAALASDREAHLAAADAHVSRTSWDATHAHMVALIDEARAAKRATMKTEGKQECSII